MSTRKVDLVVYEDENGRVVSSGLGKRRVIGEAVVDMTFDEHGLFDVSGVVTDEAYKDLLSFSDNSNYSLNVGPFCFKGKA